MFLLSLQDSVKEHELAVIAATFTDHAYATVNSNQSDSDSMFSPRKSARSTAGKNTFQSDSDFEYYIPKRVQKKESDVSDAEKSVSSPAVSSPPNSSPNNEKPTKGTKQFKRYRRNLCISISDAFIFHFSSLLHNILSYTKIIMNRLTRGTKLFEK